MKQYKNGAKLFYWKAFIYGCLVGCMVGASLLVLFGLAYSGYIHHDKKAAG